MRQLEVRDLRRRLDEGWTPLLLDVREPWEFGLARIEGSHNLPMAAIPDAVGTGELDSPEREIVVICHHGIRSRQAAYFLESVGFRHIVNLNGGVDAWAAQVDPAMASY